MRLRWGLGAGREVTPSQSIGQERDMKDHRLGVVDERARSAPPGPNAAAVIAE
jgi:hypothetical protein